MTIAAYCSRDYWLNDDTEEEKTKKYKCLYCSVLYIYPGGRLRYKKFVTDSFSSDRLNVPKRVCVLGQDNTETLLPVETDRAADPIVPHRQFVRLLLRRYNKKETRPISESTRVSSFLVSHLHRCCSIRDDNKTKRMRIFCSNKKLSFFRSILIIDSSNPPFPVQSRLNYLIQQFFF